MYCISMFLSFWENGIPANKFFKLGGRLSHPAQQTSCAKVRSCHCRAGETLRKFGRDFGTFKRFFEMVFPKRSFMNFEKIDRFQRGKLLNIVEYVGY